MIQISWNLYEIVEKAFKNTSSEGGHLYSLENEWHDFLMNLDVFVHAISGKTNSSHAPKGIAESIIDLMILLETGGATLDEHELGDYMACPDPLNPSFDGFCSILIFPKELAERILILGYFPCPVVDKAL
jgi:hypothetical protein